MKYRQGKFIPQNIQKYDGDYSNIIYRSSWEYKVFNWLDTNDKIVKWNSEEVVIPYYDIVQKKYRKYYLDVYFKYDDGREFFGEIKPKAKLNASYKNKVEFINIMNKAKATIEYIHKLNKDSGRNIEFIFITE